MSKSNRLATGSGHAGALMPDGSTSRWKQWGPPLFVVVVTALTFSPVLRGDFVFDDQENIQENLAFRGLGLSNLKWMFTTFHMGHYQPLSWMSLGADYLIWGMNPFGYHLTNLLMHCANAVLVYFLTMCLLDVAGRANGQQPDAGRLRLGSTLTALLFAIHPLRVESVAWVTERRDVLSSGLLLASVLVYLRAHSREARPAPAQWMPLCLSLYCLSLLSRAMGVTLPIILLLLDWYPLGRLKTITRGALMEKIPFLILAVAAAIVAPIAQSHVGAAATIVNHPFSARLMQAAYGLVFYVYKSLLPIALVPIYEISVPLHPLSFKYIVSAAIVIGFAVMLGLFARRRRGMAVAAMCYFVSLLPVLGFFQSGRQEVADRYSYLATIGLAVLLGAWIANLRSRRSAAIAVASCVLLTFVVVTILQCRIWTTSLSLWLHAVANGPPSSIARYNLGCDMIAHDRWAEGLAELEKSIKIDPRDYRAHYNIGRCHQQLGRVDQAIAAYLETVRLKPDYAVAHSNLAVAYFGQGRTDEAISRLRRALEIEPDNPDAQCNMAVALSQTGRGDEAIAKLEQVVKAHPDHAGSHYNLAMLLEARGEIARAVDYYRKVLRINPSHGQAGRMLEGAMKKLGDRTSSQP